MSLKKATKRTRHTALYVAMRLFFMCARRLPRSIGLHLFGALGRTALLLPHKEKRVMYANLRRFYGHPFTHVSIPRLAGDIYTQLGWNLFDALHLQQLDEHRLQRYVRIHNEGPFQKAYQRGKGVIFLTGHIGCFELLLPVFARKGYKGFAVGKKLFDKRLDDLISRTRHVRNIDYLHRNTSFRRIISRLRSGETFGVVIDQDTRVEGVFVRFLGRNAYTPSGAVKLAMRYDIPVFTATITRRHDHTHDIRISDQIPLFHGYDPTRNLLISLQIINNILSHTIIAHPSQWVWMHARWKRRPESPRYASQPCIDRPGPGPDQETDNPRKQG